MRASSKTEIKGSSERGRLWPTCCKCNATGDACNVFLDRGVSPQLRTRAAAAAAAGRLHRRRARDSRKNDTRRHVLGNRVSESNHASRDDLYRLRAIRNSHNIRQHPHRPTPRRARTLTPLGKKKKKRARSFTHVYPDRSLNGVCAICLRDSCNCDLRKPRENQTGFRYAATSPLISRAEVTAERRNYTGRQSRLPIYAEMVVAKRVTKSAGDSVASSTCDSPRTCDSART